MAPFEFKDSTFAIEIGARRGMTTIVFDIRNEEDHWECATITADEARELADILYEAALEIDGPELS